MTANETPKSTNDSPQNNRTHRLGWVIFDTLMFFVWLFLFGWPKPDGLVEIPYSIFWDQLQADNIVQVQIERGQIIGLLRSPIVWLASVHEGRSAKTAAKPESVDNFRTTYPTALGDPSLLPHLSLHQAVCAIYPA